MPAFAEHYRRLGVGHFLVVNNDSGDGLTDWAPGRARRLGLADGRELPRQRLRHALGQRPAAPPRLRALVRVVDPDEFLVYPMMETRPLRALAQFLEDDQRAPACTHCSSTPTATGRLRRPCLAEGADPFAVCPFFDRDGYLQREGWGNGTWVQGGPRLRAYFADKPGAGAGLGE